MKPTAEQIAAFEEQATAKGVPLVNLISCLPDGCDEEDTAWVLARGTTKSEARELLLCRHRVVPGVEHHSPSSAPFFQA